MTLIKYLTHQGGIIAQVQAVKIRKDKRGLGIGKKMFGWAINRSKERNEHLLQLTSDKKRPKSIKLYENMAFKATHEGIKIHFK